jgi:CDP-2,3-bis-(O-geranylgeranyl)-sn-glycerol synthase
MHNIWLSLWFFVPAGAANAAPVLVAKLPFVRNLALPLDFGFTYRGQQVFGPNKTWRGLLAGMVVAVLCLFLQRYLCIHTGWAHSAAAPLNYQTLPVVSLGVLFALGALGGDAIESFLKRQHHVPPGHSWFPFDQIDYILGGIIATLPVVRLHIGQYLWLLGIWFGIHLLGSYLGYLLKLKARPI